MDAVETEQPDDDASGLGLLALAVIRDIASLSMKSTLRKETVTVGQSWIDNDHNPAKE